MRALCLLREALHYRLDCFVRGLAAAGFTVCKAIDDPQPCDLVVCWNRYGWFGEQASRFERAGARALIVENGALGKSWRGGEWFSLTLGHHAGAGTWRDGGQSRWDSCGVDLAPWRTGSEGVVLGQRGIGEPGLASPPGWAERVQRQIGGRIRPHPGKDKPRISLEDDLCNARCVVTWASGAALSALALGTPVYFDCPSWIGAAAAKPLAKLYAGEAPLMDDEARLAMFRRLAWANWTLDEVADGTALRWLLEPA